MKNTRAILVLMLTWSATEAVATDLMDTKCRAFRPSMDFQKQQLERPKPPMCLSIGLLGYDAATLARCGDELQDYRAQVEGFIECLSAENERVVDEFNEAVTNFNRASAR